MASEVNECRILKTFNKSLKMIFNICEQNILLMFIFHISDEYVSYNWPTQTNTKYVSYQFIIYFEISSQRGRQCVPHTAIQDSAYILKT